ncbi:DUF3027 domain-containing protein [Schaalia suimastitidis]|uniref:DUF3027 domain-containing protein n=1 Tax=Schaalia suimastitidis TaxID=121163 RepID=UPI0004248EF5|nr:DUF3027 domain-containing protein [Schaalia suimastitidis]
MPKAPAARKQREDSVLASAIDEARQAALTVARSEYIGEHVGFRMDGERLGTHLFASTDPGYVGWCWAVTVARVPRARAVTVCEVDLMPGEGALLAPEWVPWEQRLRPGDYGRDDTVPYRGDDERLEQAYQHVSDDADIVQIPEVGLGRIRVLSAEGISQAATRWYASEQGPRRGRRPKDTCSGCGFLVAMSGSMRNLFGVCANEWAQDDGRVVSLDHSCGAHSETDAPKAPSEWTVRPSRVNDFTVESESLAKK